MKKIFKEGEKMKHVTTGVLAVLLAAAVLGGCATAPNSGMSEEAALDEIIKLELMAYETWYGASDPTIYAQQFADKATYFDPALAEMVEDKAIKEHLMSFKGMIPNLGYEILNPRVDLYGDVAVFVFNLENTDPADGSVAGFWKTTTVLIHTEDGWKKVHMHWTPVEM